MDVKEFTTMLGDLETRLDRLKALYEQYFQGLERLEPSVPRKDIDRRLYLLRREVPRNTALRFRFQQLLQKYTSYQAYWARVARQIEEGTYRRDLLRMRRRRQDARQQRQDERSGFELLDLDALADVEELDFDDEATSSKKLKDIPLAAPPALPPNVKEPSRPAALAPLLKEGSQVTKPKAPAAQPTKPQPINPFKPATPGRNPLQSTAKIDRSAVTAALNAIGKPPPKAAPATGANPSAKSPLIPDAQMRNIYEKYLQARKSNNERVDNVKYEAVKKTVEDMMPKLQQKHAGKAIEFEPTVVNGRVGLKPVPKK